MVNLSGKRFGRLVISHRVENRGHRVFWHCICDCGTGVEVWSAKLKNNNTRSCGCLARELSAERSKARAVPLAKRFWKKVKKSGPMPTSSCSKEFGRCWIWTGCKKNNGYGEIHVANHGPELTHRVSWFLTFGIWPTQYLLHICDNPPCVNPDHLIEGTQADNVYDREVKKMGGIVIP